MGFVRELATVYFSSATPRKSMEVIFFPTLPSNIKRPFHESCLCRHAKFDVHSSTEKCGQLASQELKETFMYCIYFQSTEFYDTKMTAVTARSTG
jgi:hypothetical protein